MTVAITTDSPAGTLETYIRMGVAISPAVGATLAIDCAATSRAPSRPRPSRVGLADDQITIERTDDLGTRTAQATLPLVLSVTDQTDEPRYPTFKDVLAAKRKRITELDLDDLGIDPSDVGAASSRVQVDAVTRNPDRQAGRTVTDTDGSSVPELVTYLTTAAR